MSRGIWSRWMRAINEDRERLGVSFEWPQHTDLTREQIAIALREPGTAAPASQPDAGRTAETVAQHAPRPQEWTHEVVEALAEQAHVAWSGWTRWMIDQWSPEFVERWERQIATPYADLSESEKESDRKEARAYLAAIDKAAAPRPQQWQEGPTPVFGDGPSMPMRSLSNDNYDRVWIAQGDHIEAMGVGDTPQEAAIEYARAVADLLRPTGGPDALDSKTAIRAQLAACRGECGDGPPTWEEWAR